MFTKNAWGVLPYISYIDMCRPKGMLFGPFWSENRHIHFAHFGLETGMVFEGTTGTYGHIYHLNSK